jgi:molecular chaperone DnaK
VRKSLTEHADKLDAGEREPIEAAIKSVEDALKTEDKAAIDVATTALMTASQKIGEKLYASQQADAAAAGAGAQAGGEAKSGSKNDDVVDADFKEVKRDA